MFAADRHWMVVSTGDKPRVLFGWSLPLSQKAANSFKRRYGGRVVKRPTARKLGLI